MHTHSLACIPFPVLLSSSPVPFVNTTHTPAHNQSSSHLHTQALSLSPCRSLFAFASLRCMDTLRQAAVAERLLSCLAAEKLSFKLRNRISNVHDCECLCKGVQSVPSMSAGEGVGERVWRSARSARLLQHGCASLIRGTRDAEEMRSKQKEGRRASKEAKAEGDSQTPTPETDSKLWVRERERTGGEKRQKCEE